MIIFARKCGFARTAGGPAVRRPAFETDSGAQDAGRSGEAVCGRKPGAAVRSAAAEPPRTFQKTELMTENRNPNPAAEPAPQPQERRDAQAPAPGGTPEGAPETAAPQPPKRHSFPNAGDLLAMLGIFLVAQVVGGFAALLCGAVPFSRVGAMTPAETGKLLAVSGAVAYVLTFCGIVGYRRMRGGRGRIARFSVRGLDPVLLLWGLVFLLAAGVVLEPLLALLPAPSMQNYGTGLWTIVAVVLFAPVFEELICRGLVLESLRTRYGVVAAWLLSSLFFGVIHLQPQLVVNAFFVGLILAYIYIRTDSLWPAMILHAVNNGVAYLMMTLGCGSFLLSDLVPDRTVYTILYVVSAAVCAASGVMVWRTLRELGRREKKRDEA